MHKHPLVIFGVLLVAAAAIFAGALVWYGKADSGQAYTPSPSPASTLKPGEPNPADALPKTSSQSVDLLGTISAVGSGEFTLTGEGSSKVVVTHGSQTKMYKQGPLKSEAVFKKEMDEFQDKLSYADSSDTSVIYRAPDPYELIPLSASGLQAGAKVFVTTTGPVESGEAEAFSVRVIE